jgi:hypothetical protein
VTHQALLIGGPVACVDIEGNEYERHLKLHLRILVEPSDMGPADVEIDDMVSSMRDVYRKAKILVEEASREQLAIPYFKYVEAGACGSELTEDQRTLFTEHRGAAGSDEVVVYFIIDTNPSYNGCAVHPDGMPGAIVTKHATRWTLAHEVGHVMGLCHVNDNERLMARSTANLTKNPPDLAPSEIETMVESALAPWC